MTKFLRLQDVLKRSGLSRSTCYELISQGKFPKPVKIGKRAIAFPEAEYEAWAAERIAEREIA